MFEGIKARAKEKYDICINKLKTPKVKYWGLFILGLGIAFPNDNINSNPETLLVNNGYTLEEVCHGYCEDMWEEFGISEFTPIDIEEEKHKVEDVKKETLDYVVAQRYLKMIESEYDQRNYARAIKRAKKHLPLIIEYAEEYGVEDIALIIAHMIVETRARHWKNGEVITSSAGAKGIMQLIASTAQGLGVNRLNLRENIEGGIKLIAENLKRYKGNIVPAITAYNLGYKKTNKLIERAGSDDFLKYREMIDSAEIGNKGEVKRYTINVLATKKIVEIYERNQEIKGKIIIEKGIQ